MNLYIKQLNVENIEVLIFHNFKSYENHFENIKLLNHLKFEKNIKSIRLGFGLHPKYLKVILEKKYLISSKKGDRLELENISV